MSGKRELLALVLACAVVASQQPFAQTVNVHIRSDGPGGKGIAVTRGLDCFIVTAAHVVPEAVPIEYEVIGSGGRTSTAKRTWRDPNGADLAVMRVADPDRVCGRDFYLQVTDTVALTHTHRTGVLRVRGEHGSDVEIAVGVGRTLGRRTPVYIYPQPGAGDLGRGLSGGMLYIAEQPAGILTEVTTGADARGTILPINTIAEKLATFLPLSLPPQPGEQEWADIARKTVGYMRDAAFCRNLWSAGKMVARPEGTIHYAERRHSSQGGMEYDLDSTLLPGVTSRLKDEENGKRRTLVTVLTRVPPTLDFAVLWNQAEQAIDDCLASDTDEQVGNVRRRSALRRDGSRSKWAVERTGSWGQSQENADIWLEFYAPRLLLTIWAFD